MATKLQSSVEKIIRDVRRDGDAALVRAAKRFDKIALTPKKIRVPAVRIRSAAKRIPVDLRKAIESCARRIQDFHWEEKKHLTQSWATGKNGVRMGQMYHPIEAVGIYAPGGRFSYPSTVLMTAIPARLAGVRRIALATPPGRLADELLFAADIAGVTEVYAVGGPAAVAALAIGTRSIPKVDLIVGPGNAFVTEAKRQLFGEVGIDLLAGPSELVVVADDSAPPEYIAADMAAQAEHDPESRSVLVTTSSAIAAAVRQRLSAAVLRQCDIRTVRDLKKAAFLANDLAGEHVQLFVRQPQQCLDVLKNGGTFFIRPTTPTAMGDYWAGPSHVLPTGRSARFASGLSVTTFLKRSSFVEISAGAYRKGWKAAHRLALAEGLVQHAESLRIRGEGEV